MCLLVLGAAVAIWPIQREKHWSANLPMRMLYWAATQEKKPDFAVSNATKGTPTRWNWAQEAFAINQAILEDLESGALDAPALDSKVQWWNILEQRLIVGGSWPARTMHAETLCMAIERPSLNPAARQMFLRWLRSMGEGSAREGTVVQAWLDDAWVGPDAASTLLYLRRHEDAAMNRLRQDLQDPSVMRRLRVMEIIVDRPGQADGWRLPSARVVELLEFGLQDENEVVRFGAAHATAALARQVQVRKMARKALPASARSMVDELKRVLDEAKEAEQSVRVRTRLRQAAGIANGIES